MIRMEAKQIKMFDRFLDSVESIVGIDVLQKFGQTPAQELFLSNMSAEKAAEKIIAEVK